jgi:hypothetical protein
MLFGGHTDWGPKRVGGTLFGITSAVFATGAFICIRCGPWIVAVLDNKLLACSRCSSGSNEQQLTLLQT